MSVIDNVRAHFRSFGRRHIDVPEWGEAGQPLRIYFHSLTLAEKQKLQYVGETEGWVARLADALILKAQDAEGKPLFTIADKHSLRNIADPDVIADVVRQMMYSPTPEEIAKNSTGTPSSS